MIRCRIWTKGTRFRLSSPLLNAAQRVWKPTPLARLATTATSSTARKPNTNPSAQYRVFERRSLRVPEDPRNPSSWLSLLELGLPVHLRKESVLHDGESLDASDVAEILLAAQKPATSSGGVDLLCHLGIVEGRWRAVVWLVKVLVEHFAQAHASPSREAYTAGPWGASGRLDECTEDPIELKGISEQTQSSPPPLAQMRTLRELTDPFRPQSLIDDDRLRHAVLGQIWRSLGSMIIASVDEVVMPEILEIIAYLHHHGVMPASIYSARPNSDETAIQPPPTLHMLSSRILTSLSDAAWRAHEKLVVEEAKVKGADYVAIRPEVPGSVYRVHVAGIRPEIWLELVLWACLHGGWILEGGTILGAIYREEKECAWKPMSWRSLMPAGEDGIRAMDKFGYLLSTRSATTMDPAPDLEHDVRRTISSEVVNAYVDAHLTTLDVGVIERSAPPGYVLKLLNMLRTFLERSSLKLGAGSWDAVILRFVDSRGANSVDPHHHHKLLLSLSAGFGGEVKSSNTQSLPSYVLDGSAAIIGLSHRALRRELRTGNLQGALEVFRNLQSYTDKNKRESLEEFFKTERLAEASDHGAEDGLFSCNYPKIDYPAFDVQIPTMILAQFMELVIDSKAYELGRWMLYSSDIDSPLIPEQLYSDPDVAPALVRFATATDDRKLLSRVVRMPRHNASDDNGPQLPRNVVQSFLDSQFKLRRWDSAVQILEYISDTDDLKWNVTNLATLARSMIVLRSKSITGETDSEAQLTQAKRIFSDMATDRYLHGPMKQQISVLLIVLSSIDSFWATFCEPLREPKAFHGFTLTPKSFNLLLEGIAETYGSARARWILGLFWPHSVRAAQRELSRLQERQLPSPRGPLAAVERQRTAIHLRGHTDQRVVMYGGLRPDLITIRIILLRALAEYLERKAEVKEDPTTVALEEVSILQEAEVVPEDAVERTVDTSPTGMLVWAARSLRLLGMAGEDIRNELFQALGDQRLESLRARLPELYREAEADVPESYIEAEEDVPELKCEAEMDGTTETDALRALIEASKANN